MNEFGRKDSVTAARTALDIRIGRALTDGEWTRAAAALLGFVKILRSWKSQAGPNDTASDLPRAA